ncbi:MAG: DNA repair protein RecO, partial [Candidatus Magasanikbacteria bacterium]|nr:DNA repair protein RecO [Candidatus Magasanikbacteria bacterium]
MQAIVLARRNVREVDQIISVYTAEYGRRDLFARGVKKITSKNTAHLEPFSFVHVGIAKGRDMDHVTNVQPIEYFSSIRLDIDKLSLANYVVSLCARVFEQNHPDHHLFTLLLTWLSSLNTSRSTNIFVLDAFIILFLSHLGFYPSFDVCVSCEKQLDADHDKYLGFSISSGGLICRSCRVTYMNQHMPIVSFTPHFRRIFRGIFSSDMDVICRMHVPKDVEDKFHTLVYSF